METIMDTTTRDARGRFTPGRSGNPKGRPLGSLNKKTLLERALDQPEADLKQAARQLSALVAAGNLAAIRVLLDRLDPKPKAAARTITIEIDANANLAERLTAVFNATVQGRINPEEALQLAQLLDRLIKTGEAGPRIADLPRYRDYCVWRDEQHRAEMREEAAQREAAIAAAREDEVRRAAEAAAEAEAETASVDHAPSDDAAPVSVAAEPEPERRRDPSEYVLPLPAARPEEPADLQYPTSISRSWHGKARYGERPRGPDGALLKRPRRRPRHPGGSSMTA